MTDVAPKILVVDDDRAMVRTLCDVMRHRGFAAHGVFSGEEALAAADDEPWSAVVMDVRMGGMSGVDVVQALQRSHVTLPVVLMTAYALPETLRAADNNAVERVLVKPFSPHVLLRTIDVALRGGSRVLLVDDDPAFLRTLGDWLLEQGWRTLRARTAETAVTLLRDHPTRLVLLDLVLNGDKPLAAATAIRAASPTVPLVLYSGHDERLLQAAAAMPHDWFRAVVGKSVLRERLPELIEAS